MRLSLLTMFNKIKIQLTFPMLMAILNIIPVYKGRGDKMDIENERGIFITNVFRSILMKMSDSNIGARKGMNIWNHIFIVNGVINEALNDKTRLPGAVPQQLF